ncbi:hypothetical protein Goarm_014372 [Gossypium armourianum]|uniref:Uncharacterized protein n=1 Tax=Gossypium armourianum TaxID=34283 RepID=A0A7J9J5X1_9ROSI|nr:hypothetical protein [Gossypium armourianum]
MRQFLIYLTNLTKGSRPSR